MSDQNAMLSAPVSVAAKPAPAAARTKLMLEGPIFPTLLRLSAPNVLNLLAFAGMVTFDGFFLGREFVKVVVVRDVVERRFRLGGAVRGRNRRLSRGRGEIRQLSRDRFVVRR